MPENETANTDTSNEESFAELLRESSHQSWLTPGQRVKAKVVCISGGSVFIGLHGKTEAVIDIAEFMDEQGICGIRAGDEVEAFFVSVEDGIRKLTTRIHGYSASNLSSIEAACGAGLSVLGEVMREIKGGFEISVGGVRCFCPHSHFAAKTAGNGSPLEFKVLEFGENGRKIVVSRRAFLEEKKQADMDRLKETLHIGDEVKGVVRSIHRFGVFVDIGGVDAMIPSSEISWERDKKAGDAVPSIGAEVTAKVIGVDWEGKGRLTLSLKAMMPDPWADAAGKYPAGSKVNGAIVRLAPFGAFLNIAPGIDGLIHISNLGTGRRISHPKEVVEEGQWIEAYVLSVDAGNRKISLSMQPKHIADKSALPKAGDAFDGIVEKVMPFGIFLRNESGLTGLVPNSEMATPYGTDHNKMFPQGVKMKVFVLEVDTNKGKVLLSRKAVLESAEKEEFNKYMDELKAERKSSSALGSLGEILKTKLKEKGQ